jgi:hypothetical protein
VDRANIPMTWLRLTVETQICMQSKPNADTCKEAPKASVSGLRNSLHLMIFIVFKTLLLRLYYISVLLSICPINQDSISNTVAHHLCKSMHTHKQGHCVDAVDEPNKWCA